MAEDVLSMTLAKMELENQHIPTPNETVVSEHKVIPILANTIEYRKRMSNRAIKKTLTIPEWLDVESEAQHVNFSQILQDALIQRLGI